MSQMESPDFIKRQQIENDRISKKVDKRLENRKIIEKFAFLNQEYPHPNNWFSVETGEIVIRGKYFEPPSKRNMDWIGPVKKEGKK